MMKKYVIVQKRIFHYVLGSVISVIKYVNFTNFVPKALFSYLQVDKNRSERAK